MIVLTSVNELKQSNSFHSNFSGELLEAYANGLCAPQIARALNKRVRHVCLEALGACSVIGQS